MSLRSKLLALGMVAIMATSAYGADTPKSKKRQTEAGLL